MRSPYRPVYTVVSSTASYSRTVSIPVSDLYYLCITLSREKKHTIYPLPVAMNMCSQRGDRHLDGPRELRGTTRMFFSHVWPFFPIFICFGVLLIKHGCGLVRKSWMCVYLSRSVYSALYSTCIQKKTECVSLDSLCHRLHTLNALTKNIISVCISEWWVAVTTKDCMHETSWQITM